MSTNCRKLHRCRWCSGRVRHTRRKATDSDHRISASAVDMLAKQPQTVHRRWVYNFVTLTM